MAAVSEKQVPPVPHCKKSPMTSSGWRMADAALITESAFTILVKFSYGTWANAAAMRSSSEAGGCPASMQNRFIKALFAAGSPNRSQGASWMQGRGGFRNSIL